MSYSLTIPGTPYDGLSEALTHAIEQLPEDSPMRDEAESHRAAVEPVLHAFAELVAEGGTVAAAISGHGTDAYTSVTIQVTAS